MNVVSLFSGAGGMDLGLEQAGLKNVLAIEIDRDCRATMQANRPSWNVTEEYGGDITAFSARQIFRLSGAKRGEIDVLAGGPPCQSFSTIGNGRGARDPRGRLSVHYFNLIEQLQPKFFIFENVKGILKHPNVLKKLHEIKAGRHNYSVEFRVLNAADFGVPQVRKRLIVIGRRDGKEIQFPEPTHVPAGMSQLLDKPAHCTVGEALSGIPMEVLLRADNRFLNHSDEMIERMSFVGVGQNFRAVPFPKRPRCWQTGAHQGADTFGRLDPDKPSVTIRCSAFNPTKGRYIHPYDNRGLSTLEMAALQKFPLDYTFVGSMTSVGRQIGNAVPPPVAKAVGHALRAMASG